MECSYCGLELEETDTFGKFSGGGMVEQQGTIYKCLFENLDCVTQDELKSAIEFMCENEEMSKRELLDEYFEGDEDEIFCLCRPDNAIFYTHSNDESNLHEGNPC